MQSRPHKHSMISFSICEHFVKAASIGSSPQQIVLIDLSDVKELINVIPIDEEKFILDQVKWTDDGQLLSASTTDGTIFTFLANLPILGDCYLSHIVYLTSIMEITTCDPTSADHRVYKVSLPIEPTVIASGPESFAVSMNNRVWFYCFNQENAWEVFATKEYLGNVKSILINGIYAAILYEEKVIYTLFIE